MSVAAPIHLVAKPAEPSSPKGPWSQLLAAPHRVMFALGAAQIVLSILWWSFDLLGRYAGWYAAPAWSVPPMWGHAYLMVYALFPLFVFGFAMTAMPNWTGQRIDPIVWRVAAGPLALGLVFTYVGFATHRAIAALGVTMYVIGWLIAWAGLARMVWLNRGRDKHSLLITTILGVGASGVLAFAWALYTQDWRFAAQSRLGGLWLFLLPLFMVVSHRLVPFFSSRIIRDYALYRPRGSLALLIAGCGGHYALELADLAQWTWTVDLPMAMWVGWLAWKWGVTKSFRARLLTMLHLSLVVLALSLALYGVASVLQLLGHPGVLGLAPLHALSIGYFTAKTVAMVSRVSLGHSGRALEADSITWRCYLAVLTVAALRVLSDFTFLPSALRLILLLSAAGLWLAALIPWSLRYAPLYFRPRADGKSG